MGGSERRLRTLPGGGLPEHMETEELVRLTMTESEVVAQVARAVARLQAVQRAKALLGQIEDPAELRCVLPSSREAEERR